MSIEERIAGRTPQRPHWSVRHLCLGCRRHPARFQYRGEVRADRDHNLCFKCYRAEVNRQRARMMAAS